MDYEKLARETAFKLNLTAGHDSYVGDIDILTQAIKSAAVERAIEELESVFSSCEDVAKTLTNGPPHAIFVKDYLIALRAELAKLKQEMVA